jgi:mono/diheme cytochrome c family protein
VPAPTVDIASASSENCIACHTDEAILQGLAEDKDVKSEATSGEG